MLPVAGKKRPIFRYLILVCLLVATVTYEVLATGFRHADWFGQQRLWKPFYIYPDRGKKIFRRAAVTAWPTAVAGRSGR